MIFDDLTFKVACPKCGHLDELFKSEFENDKTGDLIEVTCLECYKESIYKFRRLKGEPMLIHKREEAKDGN